MKSSGGADVGVATPTPLYFADYRFDEASRLLTGSVGSTQLRPKTSAVLAHLVRRSSAVVPKSDLLADIWDDAVGDEVLTVCVNELRRILRDDPRHPRYIATVHGVGYRFMPPVGLDAVPPRPMAGLAAGRSSELRRLDEWWSSAMRGQRHVGFVAGEAGSGKSTLLRAFAMQFADRPDVFVGEGRGVQQSGGGEPFLPFLDAFEAICRRSVGNGAIEVLWTHAPSWLLQLPGLLSDDALDRLRRRAYGASANRMLREAAGALEALTARGPVLVVLDDLQSADPATCELLAFLARRSSVSRLLVLAAYRDEETVAGSAFAAMHDDLRAVVACEHLELGPLSLEAVRELLAGCLAPDVPSPGFVEAVHRRTGGRVRLIAALLDELRGQSLLRSSGGIVTTAPLLDQPTGFPSPVPSLRPAV